MAAQAGADGHRGQVQGGNHPLQLLGPVRAVGVGERHHVALGGLDAGADGVALAVVVGRADHPDTGVGGGDLVGDGGGPVGGAVVDHDQLDLGPVGREVGQVGGQGPGQPLGLVQARQDDRQGGQAAQPRGHGVPSWRSSTMTPWRSMTVRQPRAGLVRSWSSSLRSSSPSRSRWTITNWSRSSVPWGCSSPARPQLTARNGLGNSYTSARWARWGTRLYWALTGAPSSIRARASRRAWSVGPAGTATGSRAEGAGP